jgi:hypothetical protein
MTYDCILCHIIFKIVVEISLQFHQYKTIKDCDRELGGQSNKKWLHFANLVAFSSGILSFAILC